MILYTLKLFPIAKIYTHEAKTTIKVDIMRDRFFFFKLKKKKCKNFNV